MKIVEKCQTMEQFDRIVNRWKEQLMQGQTDTNELVFRLRDFVQAEVDINRIKSNRWIPCSERLPDKKQKVLVFYKAIGDKNNIHDDVIATNWRKENGDFIPFDGYKITHWMPLPEPPKE